jgi:starvation-inducible DNA-binding protein
MRTIMEKLIEQLKVLQATAFSLYLKTHNFHWNVTGPNFSEYHDFFGGFYEAVWASVDSYAEHNRTLDTFVPGSLARFADLTKIADETNVPSASGMLSKLYADNEIMIKELYVAHDIAVAAKKYGIVNFLEDRIDFHEKMHWQLKSFIS